jgi:Uma2 family endonuclease
MNIRLSPPLMITTVADLLHHLGDIPPERVRMKPTPGTATVADVISVGANENRLCELVDGVLVEKAMGQYESRLAAVLIVLLDTFIHENDLGIVYGADATLKIMPDLVRIPDVSYVAWDRLPGKRLPAEPVPDLVPDLAVEVVSAGNTRKELRRKLGEYFKAGVRQVWFVDGDRRQIRVHTGARKSQLFTDEDTISGGKLLPGFSLSLRAYFDRAGLKR